MANKKISLLSLHLETSTAGNERRGLDSILTMIGSENIRGLVSSLFNKK